MLRDCSYLVVVVVMIKISEGVRLQEVTITTSALVESTSAPSFIGLEGRNSKADDGYRIATVVYLIGGQAYPCSVIQEVLFLNVCTRRDSTVVIGERGLRLIACIGVKT